MSKVIGLTWRDERVEFKPSFDLFLAIEEKVAFNRLADEYHKAGRGNVVDLPMSHVSWVLYCCLRQAGVAVRTPMDVHQDLMEDRIEGASGTIGELIVAYYGAQPEKVPKKKPTSTRRRSSAALKKTLPSVTGSPSASGESSRRNSGA